MDNQWVKILVFSILSIVLGFILGRVTGHQGGHGRMCGPMHCSPDAKCDGPRHEMKKMMWIDEDGNEKVIEIEDEHVRMHGEFDSEDGHVSVKSIIKGIEASDFEGDSTFTIGKAKVQLSRHDGEMKVEVEIEDNEG